MTIAVGGIGGQAVSNAQLDIIFDTRVLQITGSAGSACTVASRYETSRGFRHTESFPGTPPPPTASKRLRLSVIDATPPLGEVIDGELYACVFAVAPDAPLGATTLQAARLNVGDAQGGVLASQGRNGTVTIVEAPTATATPTSTPTPPPPTATATATPFCVGDCDGDGVVLGNEITKAVNIAAGTADLSICEAADANGDGEVFGNEITIAINNLANGCP